MRKTVSIEGLELAVHQGHLEFELEVRDGPQAAYHGDCALLPGELDQKPLECKNLHVFEVDGDLPEHREALIYAEESMFGVIYGGGDDDLVEKGGGPGDDIEVAVGDGVEAAGINGEAHGWAD